jgi:DNA-binding transcriptional LysR family regulator
MHPSVEVKLTVSEDELSRLEANFDLAITTNRTSCEARVSVTSLWDSKFVCLASPEYLRRHGSPTSPIDLMQHTHVSAFADAARNKWPFQSLAGEVAEVALEPVLTVNSEEAVRSLATIGHAAPRPPQVPATTNYRLGHKCLYGTSCKSAFERQSHGPPWFA